MIVADEYTLTFEEAIRAMLDGKYAAAEGYTNLFRFSTKNGFQYRTYDIKGQRIWDGTDIFLGSDLPKRKWMIVDTVVFESCPFCGSSLFSVSTHEDKWGKVEAQINCRECNSEVILRGKDMDEICDKWNKGRK